MVRFDTYKAGAFLVWQLKHAGAVIHEDGGDIIHLSLPTGEAISIHIIESSIPAYEIKNTIVYNQANGLYTLFILWADMLLPPEGHVVEVEEWEWPLLALYGEKLWAYDIFGGELFIYPIYYDRIGPYREIRYGKTVNMRQLQGTVVEVQSPFIRGDGGWRASVTKFHISSTATKPILMGSVHRVRPSRIPHWRNIMRCWVSHWIQKKRMSKRLTAIWRGKFIQM